MSETHISSFNNFTKGTWVRFMDAGIMKLGQVEYISKSSILKDVTLYTDNGVVLAESVLEYRNAEPLKKKKYAD